MKYDVDDIKKVDEFIYNYDLQVKQLMENYKFLNLTDTERKDLLKVIFILNKKREVLNNANSKSEIKDVMKLNKFIKGGAR